MEGYDKLLLAPGAAPTSPPLPGLDSPRLFSLRTVEDTFRIRSFVERNRPKTAVLAGGGLHQPGDGGKFGGDGSGGHDFAADSPADEPAGL